MGHRRTSERDLVGALERLFGGAPAKRAALVGIGDDAAVLRGLAEPLAWTVDTCVEGVHFERRWLTLEDIGERSFHAAVSDVAAMGGRPVAALSSLIVPRALAAADVLAIGRGQARAAKALRCPLLGGNLSKGGELSVTTTVVGHAREPLTRGAARPGDEVWLIGDVGLAGAGFLWLSSARTRKTSRSTQRAADVCVDAWRRPRARVREGSRLVGIARAAIDVSDGLGTDSGRIAEASRVRVVLEEDALRRALRSELLSVCAVLGADPIAVALGGGEDYALVATGSRADRPRFARHIGRIERGKGIRLESTDGRKVEPPGGFDHFSGR